MLSTNETLNLIKCLQVDAHALISLDSIAATEESIELRDRLNNGDKLNKEDILKLPTLNTIDEIKIEDRDDLDLLYKLCITDGYDLQSLFENDDFSYLSLFIDPKETNVQDFFLKLIKYKYPDFWHYWVNNDVEYICVSFPEFKIINIKKT
ncbi:TPA: hypothetical protein PXM39_003605 [Yersinia enterocolitica]|nr:hypothetical protein [Yersinia enterocolitica]HDL6900998.1 hypothetical protein [Yersinia enterocolitica]HDL7092104.1 hypothetical protein [Yersinia enterocolitica]HDL7101142.1 hypothetical protein [Yersinia enterocolitica]HDL7135624.1 hypothetical protein [Yersinia enterocolitica]